MVDLLIRHGLLLRGDGRPTERADVAIRDGLIVEVAASVAGPARRTIEADGMHVCPGFIDMHSHSDLLFLTAPATDVKVLQGVTTEVTGNCGFSLYPVSEAHRAEAYDFLATLFDGLGPEHLFASVSDYAARLPPGSTNVVPLVGHNLVRLAVNGCGRELSATALDACVGLLDENLGQGAAGASTGLLYTPACFAGTRELVALASTVARHRGLLSCHIRDEGNRLADSIGELLEVAAASGASLQISHLKVSGRANWGRLSAVLDRIQELAAAGHDITFDSYPYLFGCSTILTLFPLELLREPLEAVIARLVEPRYRAWARTVIAAPDGLLTTVGPENIRVASSSVVGPVPLVGRTLADIAPDWGCDVPELICELVAQERGRTSIFLFQMSEGDVRRALAHPLGCIGSDGIPAPSGTAHPRLGSAFLQMLCRYVRDEPVCALPEAVRKMTALPARKLGLRGRGRIDVGQVGDVVVLDLGRLAAGDTTTGRSRRGVDWVVLDGRIVVENAAYNGVRAGRLLRR